MKKLIYILLALLVSLPISAQKQSEEQSDSLIWLMSAKSAKMVDVEGGRYRKVVGPARFLHNGTYLLCDTALWNVETKVIDAWGNVSILQEETVLTSDNLKYIIDEDLAQFRGSTVQLTDKDHNTLRTRHLDYNTKDSVAVFKNGGSMRDKDGQIIESLEGTYESKIKMFTFRNNVNMFTDSIFVKTTKLIYESEKDLATFGSGTNAWQDDNMLSSEKGWYNSNRELFLFHDNVHVMTPDQEGWCDSLYFHRATQDVEMLGHAQVTDTTRNIFSLAGRIMYQDSLAKVTFTRDPAFITQTEEEDGTVDTVYLGADKLVYYTVKMCDIDSTVVEAAQKRLNDLNVDPVGEFRKKAAEAAAKAAEEEAMNDPNYRAKKEAESKGNKVSAPVSVPGQIPMGKGSKTLNGPKMPTQIKRASAAPPQQDSTAVADTSRPFIPPMVPGTFLGLPSADSLGVVRDSSLFAGGLAVTDSLAVADSLTETEVVPPDTTKIGFLEALKNVRIFKKNMQVVCDSLVYSDLDSLARLFNEPMIWQEVRRQYAADSITVVISDGAMQKASLMSNAFITIQEDTELFDQIRATEMLAFFDDKGGLKRFDALGGASALFFIEENDALATVNKTDSKMLSATFKDGEIERIYYYEDPKNDGYPVVQMTKDDRLLKGFNWQPEKRPADRNAVTPLSLRPSQRQSYTARPKATFKQTDIYFPGYMNDVYRQIEVRDSLRLVRQRERQIVEAQAAERARLDSLALADSLALSDSLKLADSLSVKDSLNVALKNSLTVRDSLAVLDSLAVADSSAVVLSPKEIAAAEKARIKAEKKAAREAARKKKIEEREARWAELDKKDAEKAAVKEAKRLEKLRKRKLKALQDAERQAQKDAAVLEKYRLYFEEQKAKSLKNDEKQPVRQP